MTIVSIKRLVVYPVKSLAGIEVNASFATQSGLNFDRQWIVIKPDGHMLTQRNTPAMALIETHIENGKVYVQSRNHGRQILESLPDAITIPVWKDTCFGNLATPEANQWITEALAAKEPLRCVQVDTKRARLPNKPKRFNAPITSFADAAPYLIGNLDSIDTLNQSLLELGHAPIDYRRFRANIWIAGLPAFHEHHYRKAHITGEHFFELVDPCSRCAMITINPDTGTTTPYAVPFNQLATLNTMPDNVNIPAFGVNAVLRSRTPRTPLDNPPLSVGDLLSLS